MRRAVRSLGWGAATILAIAALSSAAPAGLGTSIRAAHRAFRDPALIAPRSVTEAPPPPPAPPPAAEIARPPVVPDADVDRELDGAAPDDLDDPQSPVLAALTLPDVRVAITRRTLRYARYFGRTEAGRRVFLGCYRRSTRVRDLVEDALRSAELPLDIAWLPAIESGFDVLAVSPAGAAGLWQLMPETARAYGLTRTTWIDQRLDPARATRAAVTHLGDLHRRFRRWDLALAAYNAGSGRVQSAMDRLERERRPHAGPITFADLAGANLLPEETAAYVPQMIAFALVAINAEVFGLDLPDAAPVVEPGFLIVPEGTRLDTIARAAGVTVEALRALNPSLLGDRLPPRDGVQRVALPADRVEEARRALPSGVDHEVVVSNDPDEDQPAIDAGAPLEDAPALAEAAPAPMDPPRPAEAPIPRAAPPDAPAAPPAELALSPAPLLVVAPSPSPSPTVLHARLAPVSVGASLGWQRAVAEDPRPAAAVAAKTVEVRAAAIASAKVVEKAPEQPEIAVADTIDPMRVFELPNGIVVRARRDADAARVTLTTRVATLGDEPVRAGGRGAVEVTSTLHVGNRDLVAGLELCAARLRLALGDLPRAEVIELRRRAGAARKRVFDKALYGRSWLALGEALFPPRHPLAGTVLGATADASSLRDLLLADLLQSERAGARASLTVTGDVDEGYVQRLAAALLGSIPGPGDPPPPSRAPSPDRIFVEAPVPAPRLLLGWLVEAPSAADEAALRVAVELLESAKIARLHRALVLDAGLALSAHAGLEQVAQRTWVLTVELGVAPGHTADELERALDAELARLSAGGADASDRSVAIAEARARLDEEIAAAGSVTGPAGDASSALAASLRRALRPGHGGEVQRTVDAVSATALGGAIGRHLSGDRRAIVITTPARRGVDIRVAANAGADR